MVKIKIFPPQKVLGKLQKNVLSLLYNYCTQ